MIAPAHLSTLGLAGIVKATLDQLHADVCEEGGQRFAKEPYQIQGELALAELTLRAAEPLRPLKYHYTARDAHWA